MKNFTSFIKTLLLSTLLIISFSNMTAQSALSFEVSPLFSTFNFTDSQGNDLSSEYSGIITGGYSVGYRFIHTNGLILKGNLGVRKAGATNVYDGANYIWDLQYGEARIGGGYSYYMGRFSPYLTVSGYYGHLISARQTLNNHHYDILSSGDIGDMDYGIYITPGVEIEISDILSVFSEFNYIMGLYNLETGDSGQESYNRALGLSFGIFISLSR